MTYPPDDPPGATAEAEHGVRRQGGRHDRLGTAATVIHLPQPAANKLPATAFGGLGLETPGHRGDTEPEGRAESLGHDMQKQAGLSKLHRVDPDPVPGEFDALLREIEQEAVPERLLELAQKLQAALTESRRRQECEESSAKG